MAIGRSPKKISIDPIIIIPSMSIATNIIKLPKKIRMLDHREIW
jgi:hypothetical protein